MPFVIRDDLIIAEIAALAELAKTAPDGERVDRLSARRFRMSEDRPRNALMFEAGAVSRDTAHQTHYLLYCMQRWFDIRSRHFDSIEVCFYNFPPLTEAYRTWIEQCFVQAARVYGWSYGVEEEARVFDPVFRPDDCFGNPGC